MLKDRINILLGDITLVEADGIVNAANSRLAGGGGVDGAIHRAAGAEQLQQACQQYDGCPTGQVRSTPAFQLPAKRILHAVGPVWQGGHAKEADLLTSCYTNALLLAEQEQLNTLAFPAISCGIYGYPHKPATVIALNTVVQWLQTHETPNLVSFVLFDQPLFELYTHTFNELSIAKR